MLTQNTISLLQDLIRLESFSGKEEKTAVRLEKWFKNYNIPFQRKDHNIWATNKYFDSKKPTLLLNSHHDTVKPNHGYTRDPYSPDIEDGKLFGLGSNDAGGALVCLIATFTHYYDQENLAFNILIVASAEEENAGEKSLRYLIPDLPRIDIAIVGEPTLMDLAIAEKGLVVFDSVPILSNSCYLMYSCLFRNAYVCEKGKGSKDDSACFGELILLAKVYIGLAWLLIGD